MSMDMRTGTSQIDSRGVAEVSQARPVSRGRGLFARRYCSLGAALVLAGLLAFSAAPALAVTAHILSSQIDGSQTPNGFFAPGAIAHDPTSGDLYVLDQVAPTTVDKIDPTTGACIYQITGTGPTDSPAEPCGSVTEPAAPIAPGDNGGLAVDPNTGAVYVGDSGNGVVDKFDSTGHFLSQLNGFSAVGGVAVTTAGDVYVADRFANEVLEFSAAGSPVGAFSVSSPSSIAVDPSGAVYVVSEGKLEKYVGGALAATIDASGLVNAVGIDPSVPGGVFVVEAFGAGPQSGSYFVGEYAPSGQLVDRFGVGSTSQAQGSGAIAVDAATNTVYSGQDPSSVLVDVFTPIVLPDIAVGPATPLSGTEEEITGTLNPQGTEAGCEFEFGSEPEALTQTAPCEPAGPFTGSTTESLTARLTALAPNTTYYFRVNATNVNGSNDGVATGQAPGTFTTAALVPAIEAPATASNVTRTSAAVHGLVNPENSATTYTFQYGADTSYGLFAPYHGTPAGSGLGGVEVSQILNGLQPETTYHYRLLATNQAGTTPSADETFTTGAATPPLLGAVGASAITQTTAALSAEIDARGLQSSYHLDLGPTTAYGTQLFADAGSALEPQLIQVALSGLAPNTTYHYRLTATNSDGAVTGADQTFTTTAYPRALAPPTASSAFGSLSGLAPLAAGGEASSAPPKPLTRAQKLKKALTACRARKGKQKRHACEKQARKHYGANRNAKAKHSSARPTINKGSK